MNVIDSRSQQLSQDQKNTKNNVSSLNVQFQSTQTQVGDKDRS